jgi:hypothetical protein
MDHLFYDLVIVRDGESRAIRGRTDQDGLKAYFPAGADVHESDVLVDGDRQFEITRVADAKGFGGAVHHIEVWLRAH